MIYMTEVGRICGSSLCALSVDFFAFGIYLSNGGQLGSTL